MKTILSLFSASAFALSAAGVTAHAEGRETYARVIVERTTIRSGPGHSFRRVYAGLRGEVFPLVARSTRDYWFQVELPDGTFGWVIGAAVYNQELSGEEATRGRLWPRLFAPPPLPLARAELAITFGALGRGGLMTVRPTVYLQPAFGFELTGAASVSRGGRLFFGTLAGIVNLFPESPIVPYVIAGGGLAASDPNADTFLLQSGSTAVAVAGGGLRLGFRFRITLRIDARTYVFYKPDLHVSREEYSGGLSVFF